MIDLLDLPATQQEIQKIDLQTICQLEGIDSIAISLLSFEGKSFSINFQSKEEVLEGLSMACESLCQGSSYLLEDCKTSTTYKQVSDLKHIYHNGTYKLLKDRNNIKRDNSRSSLANVFATEYSSFFNSTASSCCAPDQIDESFLRKYENPFEVNLLREANVAFTHMNFGEFFYACTASTSRVKIIFARLDTARQELQVFSRKHLIKIIPIESIISISPSSISSQEIRKHLSNRFQQTSLSLSYQHQGIVFKGTKQLVFTFRTERQFDVWTAGLKAAVAQQKNEAISKIALLQHSRLFNQFFKSKSFALVDSFFNDSSIYQEHLTKLNIDYPTYEAPLLDRKIIFCFEKQIDELKNEKNLFETQKMGKWSLSRGVRAIATQLFENMSKISSYTVQQIQSMKSIVEELQKAKAPTPVTKDLLEISSNPISREQSELLEQEQRQQNITARAKKITFFYQEIFKFQYRLDQSNLLLSYFNKPPKK